MNPWELKIAMNQISKIDPIFTTSSDGCVTINGADFHETIRPWGHPSGFAVTGCERASYNGQAQPLFLLPVMRHYGNPSGGPSEPVSAPPIERLVKTIPRAVLTAIFHLPHWPVELVQIAEVYPEAFILLCKSNPALVALLAREVASNALWEPSYFGKYLGRDEKEICQQIGYGSDLARYLRHFTDVGLTAHGFLDIAISGWRKPGMRRLLTHVPKVNFGVMLTSFNHWELARECPSILHVAAEEVEENYHYSTEVCEHIEAICQMRRGMRLPSWTWQKIRSMEHLREIRQRTEEQAIKAGTLQHTVYPAPPVSPCTGWRWVSDSDELSHLSLQYHNCAETYHWRCMTGDCALYISRRTSYEDTIIVLISRNRFTQKWEVEDIVGAGNSLVDDEYARSARLHFEISLKEGGSK